MAPPWVKQTEKLPQLSNKIDMALAAYLKLCHPERQHHGAVDVTAAGAHHGARAGLFLLEIFTIYLVFYSLLSGFDFARLVCNLEPYIF